MKKNINSNILSTNNLLTSKQEFDFEFKQILYQNKTQIYTLSKLGLLVSAATTLQIFEAVIPRILPWIKPGLANSITLYTLTHYPFIYAIYLIILRGILAGMFLGTLFTPTYFISFGGAVFSSLVMFLLLKFFRGKFGYIGISVFGAIAHNLGQLEVISVLLDTQISNKKFLFSILIISAIPAGILVGYLTKKISEVLESFDWRN